MSSRQSTMVCPLHFSGEWPSLTVLCAGLDVVLQRKAKNPISGMILVSDAADSTRRAQMDLVLARAEAARYVLSFMRKK